MVIISQDDDAIINSEQIKGIYIEDLGSECLDKDKFRIVADSGNAIFPLGSYNTEEKAKQILREIAFRYDGQTKIYEMSKNKGD